MNHAYRIVHFCPDPALDGRIPVAALVRVGGSVRLARAAHLPGPDCLGGRAAADVLDMILDDLSRSADFARLPTSAGPYARLSTECEVPHGIEDPVSWIVARVLPQRPADRTTPTRRRGPHRATLGYRFLETWGVSDCVLRGYRGPATMTGGAAATTRLRPVSHYVIGAEQILLMEPLLPARADFVDEVDEVQSAFAVHRLAGSKVPMTRQSSFVTYLVGASSDTARDRSEEAMSLVGGAVYDTEREPERRRFLDLIREVHRSAEQTLV